MAYFLPVSLAQWQLQHNRQQEEAEQQAKIDGERRGATRSKEVKRGRSQMGWRRLVYKDRTKV
jgi:hypothetical protein